MSRLALLLHYILVAQVLLDCEEIFCCWPFLFFKDICGNTNTITVKSKELYTI